MATTDFGALTNAQKKIWAAEVTQEGRDDSFWLSNGFVGDSTEDMNTPVQRITELTPTERGDRCVMQLVGDLQGDGVVGDNELTDSEEALVNDEEEIVLDQLRNGVKSKGKMSEQRTVIRFRTMAKMKLKFWLAEKIDELLHLVAAGRAFTLTTGGSTRAASQLPQLKFASSVVAASTNRIKFAGAATSEATVAATDKITWDTITSLCAAAKRKRIKMIRDSGKLYYAMLLSTEQARDLKQDTTYQNNVRTAGPRGSTNVLFKNALSVIDGVILHEHNKTYNTLKGTSGSQKWGAGSNINGAQALLLGAQSLAYATVKDAEMEEADKTDYLNRPGLGFGQQFGMLKPQYRSREDGNTTEDFGVFSLKTAAAA